LNVAGFFAQVNLADLVIFAYLVGWFVLGYAQGAVRRVVGILTVTFSFFLAAQLNVYLGPYLASHWTQFPDGYAEMIGFATLFVAGAIAFALIVQGTYKRVAVFAAHPIVDELLGGVLGLPFVSQERWGGLPVTLILATFGLAFGFPLGILVALGRRSKLPAIRSLCVLYVELIRGVPLISLLFMASVMFPLFMPDGFNIDKLLRAQIAIVLFAGAYLAEVVRGGLQAVPRGQHEAAEAIGLSYWQKNALIVLPQAIRHVIPPLVNTFIAFFKDTSLVLIIGIFDLLTTAKTAVIDPAWQQFSVEVYIFVAIIYFAFCFAMSRYSRHLEAQTGPAK